METGFLPRRAVAVRRSSQDGAGLTATFDLHVLSLVREGVREMLLFT